MQINHDLSLIHSGFPIESNDWHFPIVFREKHSKVGRDCLFQWENVGFLLKRGTLRWNIRTFKLELLLFKAEFQTGMLFETKRTKMPKAKLNTASMLTRIPENLIAGKTQIVPLNKEKIYRLQLTQKHSEFGQKDTNQYIKFLQNQTTRSQVDLINKFDSMVVERVNEVDTEVSLHSNLPTLLNDFVFQ